MISAKVKFGGKIGISAALIVLLLYTVDWGQAFITICQISLVYIPILLAISFFMIFISCVKWKLFLRARKIDISITRLFMLYLIGYFFNNFLPTSVGGDVFRSLILGKEIKNNHDAFGSVFLERFTGSLGLLTLAVFAFIINQRLIEKPEIGIFLVLVSIAFCMISLLMFSKGAQAIFLKALSPKIFATIKNNIEIFLNVTHYFRSQPVVLTKAMAISFLFHIMTIVNTWVVCLALDIKDVRVIDISVVVPIILLVSMAPISLNSIGIWEGAFAFFFSLIGATSADGLSVALLFRAKNLLLAIIGGCVFVVWNNLSGKSLDFQRPTKENYKFSKFY